jgi:hypothetical protein
MCFFRREETVKCGHLAAGRTCPLHAGSVPTTVTTNCHPGFAQQIREFLLALGS